MISNFSNWFYSLNLLEFTGFVVYLIFAIGIAYTIYTILNHLLNRYISLKLAELTNQKDRLWDAYNDLYDKVEDLENKTWDYELNKTSLRNLHKDVMDIEEFLLGDENEKG